MPFLAKEHMLLSNKDILSWMLDDISYDIDKPIYIDAVNGERTISARQAVAIIRRLAAGFKALGLKSGDCVCIHAFNDIYYSMLFLGIVAAGGIFAGTNPSHTPHELSHAIETAKIKYLVVEPSLIPNVATAAQKCNIPVTNIFLFNLHNEDITAHLAAGFRSWKWLQSHGSCDWLRFDDYKTSTTTTAARLFSSGTTGLPKALELTHYNLVAQHTLTMDYRPRAYEVRRLICNPMFHVSQVPRGHTSPLKGGYVTYVLRRFSLSPWLKVIEEGKLTEISFVPTMLLNLLTDPTARNRKNAFRGLRNTWSGSAPLDKEPQRRFKELFLPEQTPFNQVWGMSETSGIATMLYPPEQDVSGSVGRAVPNVDLKIVGEDGEDISDYGVRGELCIRGPIVVKGYFGNEEAGRRDWDEDGYFHTGDVAYCDGETGLWYIVDRKKELIKVRGFQVAPAEIEGVLVSHPHVVGCAVVGVAMAKEESSELPRAYVVLRPGATVKEAELAEFAARRLARYKRLEGGVKFVESIPQNASGKALKNELREIAKRELGSKL
ncbi:4-coumarate-CoA ligase-like protein [Saccharata proteae CBS 121410]|uniref:4-coumarate-CoA ligase-like protein n=1 Tax=Saccharata proteae CBS 121410 TaxID=1314787 RepID=A0A9P4HTN7_9PEZI|nr:4-coumarate-CoA ligase-like protein [Saccharata proteae CBS 121410]